MNEKVKSLIKETILETVGKKSLLLEYLYSNDKVEIEFSFQEQLFLVKGSYECEVNVSTGGFSYDVPFSSGTGNEKESEYSVSSESFIVKEIYKVDASGQLSKKIESSELKTLLQNYINKKYDFAYEQDLAIEKASEENG